MFDEISVIASLKGNTGFYVSTILVMAIWFELDSINSSENLTNLYPHAQFERRQENSKDSAKTTVIS